MATGLAPAFGETERISSAAGNAASNGQRLNGRIGRIFGAGEGIRTLDPDLGKVGAKFFLLVTWDCGSLKSIDWRALIEIDRVFGSLLEFSRVASPTLPPCFPVGVIDGEAR